MKQTQKKIYSSKITKSAHYIPVDAHFTFSHFIYCSNQSCQEVLVNNSTLYCLDDILDLLVFHIRSGGEAHAHLEERFRNAIGIGRGILIDRLLVHRFPKGTGFYARCIHEYAQSLHNPYERIPQCG